MGTLARFQNEESRADMAVSETYPLSCLLGRVTCLQVRESYKVWFFPFSKKTKTNQQTCRSTRFLHELKKKIKRNLQVTLS